MYYFEKFKQRMHGKYFIRVSVAFFAMIGETAMKIQSNTLGHIDVPFYPY